MKVLTVMLGLVFTAIHQAVGQEPGLAIATQDKGVPLYPIHAGNEPDMRSLNSNFPTPVSFVNLRNTSIHLWWLDFDGKRVSYGTVQPYYHQEMDTYETHPWAIVDESSNSTLGIWLPVAEKGLVLVF